MVSQSDIYDRIKELIPSELWDKHSSDTFEEMANVPELSKWRNELLQAEEEWWEIEKENSEIKKRSPFKGRGKTERPTCPKCGEDLKRSYTRIWNPETKRGTFVMNGWECQEHQYKIWDKKQDQ